MWNKETSEGCPPGLKEKVRVTGILGKLCMKMLSGSQAEIATDLHRIAVVCADYVLLHGKYSPTPAKLSDFSLDMARRVNDELTRRLLKNSQVPGRKYGEGKALATCPDLLTGAPWFMEVWKDLIKKHPEYPIEAINAFRRLYVVKNSDTVKLRTFANSRPNLMADEVKKNVTSANSEPVLVQGGGIGDLSMKKERKVLTPNRLINLERNSMVEEVKAYCKEMKPQGGFSLNSQTQKGTLTNLELMNEYGLPCAVSVLPVRSSSEDSLHKDRFFVYAAYDCKDKAEMARALDVDINPPIRIKKNENIIVFDFKQARLEFEGIYFNGWDLEVGKDFGGFLRSQRVTLNGYTDNLYEFVRGRLKRFRKFNKKTTVPGDTILKPKIDGVSHIMECDGKSVWIVPRTFDTGRPFIVATGKFDVPFTAYLELCEDGTFHVYRITQFGPFEFLTDSVQRNLAFERSFTISLRADVDGKQRSYGDPVDIPFCREDICNHPIDGVTIQSGRFEVFWKYHLDYDVLVERRDDLHTFLTKTITESGEIFERKRYTLYSQKQYQQNAEEGVTPDPALLPLPDGYDYRGRRPRGYRCNMFICELDKAKCRVFTQGCAICARAEEESCIHGRFCHEHGCDDPACELGRSGGVCRNENCGRTDTVHCQLGEYHCGDHACPPRKLGN